MKIVYFYAKDGKKIGPLSREQLDDLHLAPNTLVWHYGLSGWIPYKNLPKQVVKEDEESPFDKFCAWLKSKKKTALNAQTSAKSVVEKQVEPVAETKEATVVEKQEEISQTMAETTTQSVSEPTDKPEILTPSPKKKGSWKKITLIVIASIVAFFLLASGILYIVAVNSETYPEYVKGFHAKSLMFRGKNNNSLCAELIKKAEAANEANLPELERYYYDAAAKVGTSDDDVLFTLGTYYESNEVRAYSKALEIFQKIKNQERADVLASEAWCNYQCGNSSTAIQKAQQAFMNDPTNILSTITLYCTYHNNNDWDNCIKWADKSIELRPNFGQTYYVKAHAQYEKGYKSSARETYNKALSLDPDNRYAADYAYIGGLPFTILSTDVANVHYNGNTINGYGQRINSNKTEYLKPRLRISPNRTGSFKIDVKLYRNGNLSTGDSSKDGYSYSYTVNIRNREVQNITLNGWGSESPGHWSSGYYRFEFYFGGKQLGSKSFRIYDWWED